MDTVFLMDAICSRMDEAVKKHPLVASRVLFRTTDLANTFLATQHKQRSIENTSVEDALLSEVHEFLIELNKNDRQRAWDEMIDIIIVAIRAYESMTCLEKSKVNAEEEI